MGWLDFFSVFDWITPTAAFLDGREDIIVNLPDDMSAFEVQRYLRRHGVKANLPQMEPGNRVVIAVDNVQKAQRILRRLR